MTVRSLETIKHMTPQALDVWIPLFPVDPSFSTKLNFTKFIIFPLNTCIKHKGKKQMAAKFVPDYPTSRKISPQAQNIQIFI